MRRVLAGVVLALLCDASALALQGWTGAGKGGGGVISGAPANAVAIDPSGLEALGPALYLTDGNAVMAIVGGVVYDVAGNHLNRGGPMPAPGVLSPALTTRLQPLVNCVAPAAPDEVYFSSDRTVQLRQGGAIRTVVTDAGGSVGGCLADGEHLYVSGWVPGGQAVVLRYDRMCPLEGCGPPEILAAASVNSQFRGMAFGAGGALYVVESGATSRVLSIGQGGSITTVAGGGTASGSGIPATSARLSLPEDVAFDPATGDLYLTEAGTRLVRRVDANGVMTTVAGSGGLNFASSWIEPEDVGGDMLRVPMAPRSLAITSDRILWVSAGGGRISALPLSTVAPAASPTRAPSQTRTAAPTRTAVSTSTRTPAPTATATAVPCPDGCQPVPR